MVINYTVSRNKAILRCHARTNQYTVKLEPKVNSEWNYRFVRKPYQVATFWILARNHILQHTGNSGL